MWPAATVTPITPVAAILGLAESSELSVAQLFDEQGASEGETSASRRANWSVHRNAWIVGNLPGRVGSSTRHAVESCRPRSRGRPRRPIGLSVGSGT
jgi:hypothetical protein